jgi:Phage tail assembly chaperone proteins, E, or 41 or 14
MDDFPNSKPLNSAPSVQAAAAPPGSIIVPLRKTVIANGDETRELVFREPTAGDIEYCGNPVDIDLAADPPKISFNAKSMTAMMSRLALVPPSTIRQMHPRDWETIAWKLAPFFLPDLLTN